MGYVPQQNPIPAYDPSKPYDPTAASRATPSDVPPDLQKQLDALNDYYRQNPGAPGLDITKPVSSRKYSSSSNPYVRNNNSSGLPDPYAGSGGAPPPGPPGTPPTESQPAGTPREFGGDYGDTKFGGTPAQKAFVSKIRAMSQGKSEDFERHSAAQIAAWEQYYDEAASQKAGRPQFRSARGAPGFFDKPSECPEGQVPQGAGENAPCGPMTGAGGGGGWGGGPGGGGPGGGGAGGWGITDEERKYLESMGALADTMRGQSEKLFARGYTDYANTSDYYRGVSGAYGRGGIEAALGPTREMAAETFAGERAKLRGLRGAEKAQAEAELARTEAGTLARQPAELQAQAAAGLGQTAQLGLTTGLESQTTAAGIYGNMAQALMNSRLTEEGFDTQKWIADLQTKTQWKIASLQATVDREKIAQEKDLAQLQLAENARQWDSEMFYKGQALDAQVQEWIRQSRDRRKQGTQDFWLGAIGAVMGMAGGLGK